MKLEELIEKVERAEKQIYESCQMVSDLRVLIVGLYDEKAYWREKYMDYVSKDVV